jgi:hypothetical protein
MSLHEIFDYIWNFPIPWPWIFGILGTIWLVVLVSSEKKAGMSANPKGPRGPQPASQVDHRYSGKDCASMMRETPPVSSQTLNFWRLARDNC